MTRKCAAKKMASQRKAAWLPHLCVALPAGKGGRRRDFGKNVFEERQQLGRREKRRKRGGGSSLGVGLTKGACPYDVCTKVGGGLLKI